MSGGGQSKGGANAYTNSANNLQSANNMLSAAATGFGTPGTFNPSTYNAAPVGATGMNPSLIDAAANYDPATYNAASAAAANMNPALIGSAATYNPALSANPNSILTGMGQYYNPFTDNVINRSAADMQRNNEIQQQQIKAAAARSGAFGGSRQGLVEAETNAETNRAIGDMSGMLRNQMFNTAAGLSAQDIGNNINVNAMNQSAQNQAGQFNANSNNAVSAANQASQNNANQFNAANSTNVNLANAAAQNTAGQFNSSSANQAGQFNTAADNAALAANQNSQNNASQYNATNAFNANLANANATNTANQFNAGATNTMRLAANNDDLSRNMGLLSAASGMSGLGQQNFGIGQSIGNQQMAQGGLLQGMEQLMLDDARGMFNEYTNSPVNALNLLTQAAGMSPLNNQSTGQSSRDPGLFDYLGLGLQAAGIAFPRGF